VTVLFSHLFHLVVTFIDDGERFRDGPVPARRRRSAAGNSQRIDRARLLPAGCDAPRSVSSGWLLMLILDAAEKFCPAHLLGSLQPFHQWRQQFRQDSGILPVKIDGGEP
jgi:hypothetical protein